MDETGIKDERLQRLMKAARNAGGTFEADMGHWKRQLQNTNLRSGGIGRFEMS
jgi:hypothetical protein